MELLKLTINTQTVFRVLFVIVSMVLHYVHCNTMGDARKLLSEKLQNYDKNFRPMVDQSAPLTIDVAMEVISIQEFDEVQERLTITAILLLSWVDEYMKWNNSDFGGIRQILVDSEKVWTPNIVLINNVNKLDKIGDSWHKVRFLMNGEAIYFPADVLSASCSVDVTYYPLDRHKCSFQFTVWGHLPFEVQFKPTANKVQTGYFSENGAWTFYDSAVRRGLDNIILEYVLYLDRKPRFVFVNVIIPIIAMAYLNAVSFLVPSESGEKISCSITVLLALAVFLTLVGDNLPKTSSPMSFFSYFLLIVLIISICMTLATVFIVRVHYYNDSEPAPNCLKTFLRCTGWTRRNKRKQKYLKGDKECKRHIKNNNLHDGRRLDHSLKVIFSSGYEEALKSKRVLRTGTYEADVRTEENVTWKDISAVLDKMCFVTSVVALTVSTITFFVYISTDRQD